MKIGIITLNIVPFSKQRYYNTQEEGMGKALAAQGHEVVVYYLTNSENSETVQVQGNNYTICYIRAIALGKHAFPKKNTFSRSLDFMIACSDNHLYFPQLLKWCRKNQVYCIPYVGVIRSNNANSLKKFIMDIFCSNIHYYRQLRIAAKTPKIMDELQAEGISRVSLIPVGLDVSLLNKEYQRISSEQLKLAWGFQAEDKILLYVGRLEAEKEPLLMLSILKELVDKNYAYKLLMIGTGVLLSKVEEKIKELRIENCVRQIQRIPYEKMWEAYRISECMINLNKQEIFGMSILEAMYYRCRVIAWDAPGPRFVLGHYAAHHIKNSKEGIMNGVLAEKDLQTLEAGYRVVMDKFTWDASAQLIVQLMNEIKLQDYGE